MSAPPGVTFGRGSVDRSLHIPVIRMPRPKDSTNSIRVYKPLYRYSATCATIHILCHLCHYTDTLPLVPLYIYSATCATIQILCHLYHYTDTLPLVPLYRYPATCATIQILCHLCHYTDTLPLVPLYRYPATIQILCHLCHLPTCPFTPPPVCL